MEADMTPLGRIELGVDASIKEIFEAESIDAFVGMVCERIVARKVKGGGGKMAGDG